MTKKKTLIRNGLEYKQKSTNEVFTLNKDYNGLWYLDRRDEKGYKKTLSQTQNDMLNILESLYERA